MRRRIPTVADQSVHHVEVRLEHGGHDSLGTQAVDVVPVEVQAAVHLHQLVVQPDLRGLRNHEAELTEGLPELGAEQVAAAQIGGEHHRRASVVAAARQVAQHLHSGVRDVGDVGLEPALGAPHPLDEVCGAQVHLE
ncbi:hypothetical protein GCM10029963_01780 [Micromonospora andamanensis]